MVALRWRPQVPVAGREVSRDGVAEAAVPDRVVEHEPVPGACDVQAVQKLPSHRFAISALFPTMRSARLSEDSRASSGSTWV